MLTADSPGHYAYFTQHFIIYNTSTFIYYQIIIAQLKGVEIRGIPVQLT